MVPTPEAGGDAARPRDPDVATPQEAASLPSRPSSGRRSLHETAELALQRVHERVGRPSAAARRLDAGPLFGATGKDPEVLADPEAPADPEVLTEPEADASAAPRSGPEPGADAGSRSEPGAPLDTEPPSAPAIHRSVRQRDEERRGLEGTDERTRVVIRDLVVRRNGVRVQVVATLALGDRAGCGTAEAPATLPGLWRGVGEATLAAVDELAGSALQVAIDRITVASGEEPPSVRVLLTAKLDADEETLLGATLLHEDPAPAVMRATLDALNGRIEPLLRATRAAAAAD
jgi:hypothetical protein